MIDLRRIEAVLARFPVAAVVGYFALIAVFVFVTIDGVLQIAQQREAVTAASEILNQIEVRDSVRRRTAATDVGAPAGSPFLEGATASGAGAALLQRVAAATKRMNVNIQSSQVDLQGGRSTTGFITATSTFDIDSAKLQPLLYDLEAGMPFLFVDELVIQAPSGAAQGSKLRVILGVSGQRQTPK